MAQPGSVPRWASTVTADPTRVVEPTSGKKDVGYASQERPTAQHINWLLNNIYLWVLYLQGLAGEALTWTAAHIHSAAVTFNAAVTHTAAITLSGAGQTINGDANFQNEVSVLGAGGLTVTGGIDAGGAVEAGGNVESTGANVEAAFDVVAGGDIKYGTTHDRWISACIGQPIVPGDWLPIATGWMKYTAGSSNLVIPVVTESGETIVSWGMMMDNDDPSLALFATMEIQGVGGTTTIGGGTSLTRAAASSNAIVSDTINHVVAANSAYLVTVSRAGGVPSGNMSVGAIRLTVMRAP